MARRAAVNKQHLRGFAILSGAHHVPSSDHSLLIAREWLCGEGKRRRPYICWYRHLWRSPVSNRFVSKRGYNSGKFVHTTSRAASWVK